MKKLIALLYFVFQILFLSSASASDPQDSILGKWKTYDENNVYDGIVEIYKQNDEYFGKIVYMPNPAHKDSICSECEGEDKDKPVLGLVFLKNMKKDKDYYTEGTILDPYSGKVYSCEIHLENNGRKLKVRGYVGFCLFGSNRYWDRIKDESIGGK